VALLLPEEAIHCAGGGHLLALAGIVTGVGVVEIRRLVSRHQVEVLADQARVVAVVVQVALPGVVGVEVASVVEDDPGVVRILAGEDR